MNSFARIIASFVVLVSMALAAAGQGVVADLVITGAKIKTMDAARPDAQAIAVKGNKVIAVGTDAEIKRLVGPSTRQIAGGGRLIVPGFNDSHVHFLETGQQLSLVDLRDADTPQEFARRIGEFAKKLPKGRWILGGKWDHENWTPNDLPTAALIDAVTPDHPVFIDRLDGHMALANTRAMKLAGVTKDTPEVDGGEIVRDANGNPAGVFKDAAMGYINKVIPAPSWEERLEGAQAATDHAAAMGITSVQDMSAGRDVGVYQELHRRGTLKTRVYGCSPLSDYQRWVRTGVRAAFGDEMLRVGCLKGFSDGSLGSTTAWFFQAYLDAPNSVGLPSDEIPTMPEMVEKADKAGLQINIHAIGDKANATVLDIFARTVEKNGERDRRFRIEHAQHLRQEDIKRFGGQKVVASMQPYHAIDDGRWAWKRLDEPRIKGTYAFRTLLDTGGVLAFGSDSPVAPIDPIAAIYASVTRRTLDDKNPNGWVPEQKISLDETIRAYTWGSAYAEFQEQVKGTLAPGMLADMVILSHDLYSIAPERIRDAKVMMTIVDGRVVYEAK